MNATTVVAMAALGAGVLIDLPGLRYEVPRAGEPGPMEWDLRWYVPREPEVEALVLGGRSGVEAMLTTELRERLELWDAMQREREDATEPEGLIQQSEPRAPSIQSILEGTQDPSFPLLFADLDKDLLPLTHGDFDRDGTLTLADLDAYSAAFVANALRADLNRDGQVDAEDLRIYLAAFDANFRP